MKALITGITGQDGSYLAELLLEKGYEVHGIIRRSSSFNTERIDHIIGDIRLFVGELTEGILISQIISSGKYDEVYNLAAQSDVRLSFDIPEYTGDVDALGVVRLLEAIRFFSPKTKFYQASSSEMYGGVRESFYPRSPYACAKLYAYHMVRNYREGFELFACNGILFNHESPRRGENFVTRKITKGIKDIREGKQHELKMGNILAERDWGYAPDYVKAMWMMLQHSYPDDYVIATGEKHSVKEFLKIAFRYYGYDYKNYVTINHDLFRPTEVEALVGDYSKAKKYLGWEPTVKFERLVQIMMEAET